MEPGRREREVLRGHALVLSAIGFALFVSPLRAAWTTPSRPWWGIFAAWLLLTVLAIVTGRHAR